MSTIKGKFNIWAIITFLGCMALSIIITNPFLAKADDEGHSEVVVDTTFSDTKDLSLDLLNVGNSIEVGKSINVGNLINIGNSRITSNGRVDICDSNNAACLHINGNQIDGKKIAVSQVEIGVANSRILLSGNKIYNISGIVDDSDGGGNVYTIFDNIKEDDPKDEDLITYLLNYHTPYLLYEYGLFGFEDSSSNYAIKLADKGKPLFATKGSGFQISFLDNSLSTNCSEENAGKMRYVEYGNGSKLLMCMKTDSNKREDVVIIDKTN